MEFRWKQLAGLLFLIPLFVIFSCGGGGGGGSSAPPPPTATTTAATNITIDSATANGTVNPNGLDTDAWFEWGTDPTLAISDNTTTQSLAAGTTVQAVNAPLTGLTFGTTYYFRMVAQSTSGTEKGAIQNFSTSPGVPPTVTTSAATALTTTSATLNGSVNPNGLATTAMFEWGTDPTLSTFTSTAPQNVGSGSASLPVSAPLTVLANGTTYYFRMVASNASGTDNGTILNFSTANPPPVASAGPDQSVLQGRTVTLDGSGSSAAFPPITYLWEQVAGTAVTLSDNTAVMPTFTAPTVTPIGAVLRFQLTVTDNNSLTASDTVDITVLWGFADDFSTDTTGSYTSVSIDLAGNPAGPSTFTYDAGGERAQVTTADNFGLIFSKALPANDNGSFSFDFIPIGTYPSGGGVWVRLRQDPNNYYELAVFNWDDPLSPGEPSYFAKVVGGVTVDNVAFTPNVNNYDNVVTRNAIITFTPTAATAEGFLGGTPTMNTDTTPIDVSMFEIQMNQQDADIDNIELLVAP